MSDVNEKKAAAQRIVQLTLESVEQMCEKNLSGIEEPKSSDAVSIVVASLSSQLAAMLVMARRAALGYEDAIDDSGKLMIRDLAKFLTTAALDWCEVALPDKKDWQKKKE